MRRLKKKKKEQVKKTRFIKTIGITLEHNEYIESTKRKKSKAGRLEEIIDAYRRRS